jgi:cobalt/nickel transport system ATP-binding protein
MSLIVRDVHTAVTPLMALEGASVRRAGRLVLEGASFSLAAGERVAVVGPNGAGKSTLLRTLVGLEVPVAGTLMAFGAACRREADFAAVRRRIGLLFQDPDDQLVAPTVLEDVAFGPLNHGVAAAEAFAVARATLDRLGLGALADRITHHLSGGEKRLVALAGVLAVAPDVLLLDEPTVALDPDHRARLLAILSALPQAMAIVSHDHDFLAALATRAVEVSGGAVHAASVHRHTGVTVHIHALKGVHGHG